MNNATVRSRKNRRMTALLLALILILALTQGPGIWLKVTHPFKYEAVIRQYAGEYGLDPLLVAAVINVESKFRPEAQSKKGAKGLMQVMDTTALWAAETMGLEAFEAEQLYDPQTNVRIGCWYLSRLLQQYGGDLSLALAAYNGGSGNVARWLGDPACSSDGVTLDSIPFPETAAYVQRVTEQTEAYGRLYGN